MNNNPHCPSIFSENLCKFGWISSDSFLPSAWAITLFLPNRKLVIEHYVFMKITSISMIPVDKIYSYRLSFHCIRTCFNLPLRILLVWKMKIRSYSSTAFWTFLITFCLRSMPFLGVLVNETEKYAHYRFFRIKLWDNDKYHEWLTLLISFWFRHGNVLLKEHVWTNLELNLVVIYLLAALNLKACCETNSEVGTEPDVKVNDAFTLRCLRLPTLPTSSMPYQIR